MQQSYRIQQLDHVPSALLEEMLSVIKDRLPQAESIIPRSKFILTELVSNAIKHANASESDITISLDQKELRIIKTDKGSKLDVPQIRNGLIQDGDVITTDIMHTLYSVSNGDRMDFYCYEHPEPSFSDEHNYPEHFGLLIITKASDEFYYTFNPVTHENTFSVRINF